jgi:hypothetical protein
MPNVTGADILSRVRTKSGETDPNGRWPDDDILELATDACYDISMRVDWPEGTALTTTSSSYQEYPLFECIAILRVYLGGQLIFPTSQDALEGNNIQVADMRGPNGQPLWRTTLPTVYPTVSNPSQPSTAPLPGITVPVPTGDVMYYPGMRPKFYLRGGNIGFVYPPAGAYTLQVDYIPPPIILQDATTETAYPYMFLNAIVYYVLAEMYSSDDNDQKASTMMNKYEKSLGLCVKWRRNILRGKPRTLYGYPYRLQTYWSR